MANSDTELEFVPLHFAKKLRIVNPRGRIGIVTLWSKIDFVVGTLLDAGVDLGPKTSKIAVIGNLYGNGLPHLLRNLLYNPQIRDLVVCGVDRSGSAGELAAFLEAGLEEAESLGEEVMRIKGTDRIIDGLVRPEHFGEKLRITRLGEVTVTDFGRRLAQFLSGFEPKKPVSMKRVEIELPEVNVSYHPSEVAGHQIIKDTPLLAWQALVQRIVRFGHLVHLAKGDRQELPNVRVVIRNPRNDDPDELAKFGFRIDDLSQYQADMLSPDLPPDQSYTYGNRIRQYFGYDALECIVERLRADLESRHCFHSLWDSRKDGGHDSPCLVSIFFRIFDGKLMLTATYRTHNALDGWLKNVYGLMKLQEIVTQKVGIPAGALTVVSYSISVDPSKYEEAKRIAASCQQFSVEPDPCGQILIEVDAKAGEIVVRHADESGRVLGEYRSKKAERLQHELAANLAISDVGHAIYVGRELAGAEACLASGKVYEQ